MLKKIGSFFEDHVEKIVLIIVGILSFILFIVFVLRSPNTFEYVNDDGKTEKLSPGELDGRIFEDAMKLNQNSSDSIPTSDSSEPNEPRKKEYLALLESSIGNVTIATLSPDNITPEVAAHGPYVVPESIGRITEVAIEHIRAAAYVPTEPVTEQRDYDQVEHEPNDIDLVTVQGEFDIAGLCSLFEERFRDQVPEEWALDPCLVKPIFASVRLQRRELLPDGGWSDWQNVPKSRIDRNSKLFELIQDDKNLPPGLVQIQKLQFENKQLQIELLQPQTYQFASAREEWFPPLLHKTYKTAAAKEKKEEIREAREAEKQERNRDTTGIGTRRGARATDTRGRTGAGGTNQGIYGEGGRGSTQRGGSRGTRSRGADEGFGDGMTRGSRTRGRDDLNMDIYGLQAGGVLGTQISPIDEVYRDFNKIQLTWTTDLSKMREPLVLWAHDDTVEPQKTYQYRMRLGVFNPVAQGEQDDPILWGEFSDVTQPVDIPGKLYFCATRPETAKTVTVKVCKYFLGYWRSEDFRGIGPGGAIGGIKEYEPEEPEEDNYLFGGSRGINMPIITRRPEETSVEPESINFDTGAVVVDVVPVNEWVASGDGNLSNESYTEMLYSFDGANIEHMPVSLNNWPVHMMREFTRVERLSREDPEPFKDFGSRTQQRGSELYPGGRGGEEDYYMEEMMMEGQY